MSKKRRNFIFLEAAILTLIVYILALLMNAYLDVHRIEDLDSQLKKSEPFFSPSNPSNQFFSLVLDRNCSYAKDFIYDRYIEVKNVGTNLENYGKLISKRNKNFSEVKQRQYYLDQLALYNLAKKYNKKCGRKEIIPVIYFFDGKSTSLNKQGFIMEQFYLNHKNSTMILPFDINFDKEPVINQIKNEYNIKNAPFVIMGNKTTRDFGSEVVSLGEISLEFLRQRGELKE